MRLRNLEYDLTSAIKKTVYGFQSVESVLSAITDPVQFTLFVTPDLLPAEWGAWVKNLRNGSFYTAVVAIGPSNSTRCVHP